MNNLLRSPAAACHRTVSLRWVRSGTITSSPRLRIVVGIEADAQYMDLQRTGVQSIFRPAFNPNVLTTRTGRT